MRRVHSGAFSAVALASVLAEERLPRQERAFLTDLVYGTLRHLLRLDACLRPRLSKPSRLPADVRAGLRLASYEILIRGTPRYAAVHAWVDTLKVRHEAHAGLVNAVLRRVSEPAELTLAERGSVPAWLYDSWGAALGEAAAEQAAHGMLQSEPLWVTAFAEEASALLQAEGCKVTPGPLKGTLAVQPAKPLAELTAFRRGLLQPQNPASRLPALVLAAEPDQRVLDLCSGAGIKTAQLAAGGAKVVAVERDARKVAAAARNLERLGLDAEHHVADLRSPPQLEPAAKVLLDAPCSGTGTLRGNPDIKLRLTPEAVAQAAELQRDLLATAAKLTGPGGLLVYAVCTLTKEEGVDVARRFLARHDDFVSEPFDLPVASRSYPEGRYVLPVAGLDGFFIARFRRTRFA